MLRIVLCAVLGLSLASCNSGTAPATTWEETVSGKALTAEELAARAPNIQTLDNPGKLSDLRPGATAPGVADPPPEPPVVPIAKAGTVKLGILSESGYLNENRKYVIDLLEGDLAYLSLKVETTAGNPVSGATPTFTAKGRSQVSSVSDVQSTDESGMVDFGIVGGKMGEDHVLVHVGGSTVDVLVNVISLRAAGYPDLGDVPGALGWGELKKARVKFSPDGVEAVFPPAIAQHDTKRVKLVGFMMPLESEEKQKHFLLTSNPPSCFFHIPGGPAGAVEVFAPKGIKASWDPLILEGRFETVNGNELGVIYRLHDARVVKP